MKQEFIVKGEKSPYSRAERHLAERLKTLRRDYKDDKQTFIDHLIKKIGDIQFTKAEADRIWDRMHKLQYFSDGETIVMLDKKHKLHFPQYFYSGNNNSFDNYAVELLSKDVFVHHGGVPGVCTEAKARAIAKARAARWGKNIPEEPKEEPAAEPFYPIGMKSAVYNEKTGEFELPKQEEVEHIEPDIDVHKGSILVELGKYSTEELIDEIIRRGWVVNLSRSISPIV